MKSGTLRNIPLILFATLLVCTAVTAEGSTVEKAKKSVVRIIGVARAKSSSPTTDRKAPARLLGTGSGFVLNKEGLIATNAHVAEMLVEANQSPVYRFLRGNREEIQELYVGHVSNGGAEAEILRAEVEWIDRRRDMALLRVPGIEATPVKLNISEVQDADFVFSLGFPGHADDSESGAAIREWIAKGQLGRQVNPSTALLQFLTASQSSGTVRRIVTKRWEVRGGPTDGPQIKIIQSDVNFSPGNSGGPLFNAAGHVIGINTAINEVVRESAYIGELHSILQGRGATYSWTARRPLPDYAWWIIAAGGGVLLGVTALVLALRRPAGPGHTTVMKWVADARGLTRQSPLTKPAPRPVAPPIPTVIDPKAAKTKLVQHAEATQLNWTKLRDEPVYSSFTLEPVEMGASPVELADARFAEQNGRLILGRSTELADICVDDRNISKRHAALRVRGTELYIEDLESSNGTRVNGKKLEPYTNARIADGDTIMLGNLKFLLRKRRR